MYINKKCVATEATHKKYTAPIVATQFSDIKCKYAEKSLICYTERAVDKHPKIW